MKYNVISGHELTFDMVDRWREIQKSDSSLANPYFCPEFTQAVAAVRDDVFIGLIENQGNIVGFFPFHRSWGGRTARSIGLGLSDYHGVIVDPCMEWMVGEFMKGCGLIRWEFDHLLVAHKQFEKFYAYISNSPIIDVSQGFEEFISNLDKSGRKQLKEARRKREKLESDKGSVRFTMHTDDVSVLRQLMAWKSLQCRQTGTVDYFALKWCVNLIERIHATRDDHFGGILSCLHTGETLAAAHFVMYSRNVLHSWFPAYSKDLKEYSPGLILLYEMIRTAANGVTQYIDLGKGLSLYKKKVMTGGIPVAEGCVEIPSIYNHLLHFWKHVEQYSRQSVLKAVLRIPGRYIKKLERKSRYE